MEYSKIDKTSYNIHLIKTKKFKTINIRVSFKNEIKKEEITIRNFLCDFMTYSNSKYKTRRELILKTQDLYGAQIFSKSSRVGNYSNTSFFLSMLNPKYTEPNMLEESIELLSDIIFKPNFINKKSFKENYDYLIEVYKNNLSALKDNKDGYSSIRLFEEMGKGKIYSYRNRGYFEDIGKISIDSLKKYYDKLINNSLVDIYVIGDIDNSIVSMIDKYFSFKTYKGKKKDLFIIHDTLPKLKTIIEKDDNNQSKLCIGCKIYNLSEFERNYVLTLYNIILGASSESKFFRTIREENSLAYYVYSSLAKLDNLMIIRAGISKENFNKVVKLVKKLMNDMKKGNITLEDIKKAQENYISMLNEMEDSEYAIIEGYIAKDILNLGDIEERKEMIKKVTKEDIVKISKKIKIDTIYLLEGDGQIERD